MSLRQPDFDIDREIGAQAELWVSSIREALRSSARIEVKAPKPFLREQSFYVEYVCRRRDGTWRPSGIATTKASVLGFTFGSLPGGLFIETEWVRRAARRAYKNEKAHRQCSRGGNPTKGVLVSLMDLWATRDGEP